MKDLDFAHSPVWRLVISLSIPTCLSQAVNVLYAVVDRMFIGHMPVDGAIALAGVGVAAPVTSLISSFAVLFGLGGAPLMAMREGHGDHEEAVKVEGIGFALIIIASLVITPLCLILRRPLLSLFGSSVTTLPYALEYLTWYVIGTPFALISTGMNSYLTSQGRSRRAMCAVITGAVLNIALDPLFIYVFGMGVKGAALATVISQAVSAIVTVTGLLGPSTTIPLRLARPEGLLSWKITKLGLSPFLIIATDSLLMILLNTVLQLKGGPGLGDMLVTASTIIQSYHMLVMNPLGGITGGSQGLISYSYGSGDVSRVKAAYLRVQVLATLYTIIMMALAWTAGDLFIALFTQDGDVAALTGRYLKVFTAMIIPLSLQYNNVDTFTALGKPSASLPLSLFRKAVFTISLLTIPLFASDPGASFWAEPVSDIIAAAVSTTTMSILLPRILTRRKESGLSI